MVQFGIVLVGRVREVAGERSRDRVQTGERSGRGQDGDANVHVAGPVQVNFRRLTFKPGATTGKHCHYGRLVGVVEAGALTHYASIYPGGMHVYHAGDTINEGPGYVHEGVDAAAGAICHLPHPGGQAARGNRP